MNELNKKNISEALSKRDPTIWNEPSNTEEYQVVENLYSCMKLVSPGRIIGLLSGIFFSQVKDAKNNKDLISEQQSLAVGYLLDQIAFAVDRIWPS